jgi:hypothetical protein
LQPAGIHVYCPVLFCCGVYFCALTAVYRVDWPDSDIGNRIRQAVDKDVVVVRFQLEFLLCCLKFLQCFGLGHFVFCFLCRWLFLTMKLAREFW